MQSLLFVFAGLQTDMGNDKLPILAERLHELFSEQLLPVAFTRKDRLLISRFEDAGFYISIFTNKKEIKDWYRMATDFELTAKPNPVSNEEFEKRIKNKQIQFPNLYKEAHYLLGRLIYSEIDKFDLSKVYFFL